MLWGTQNPKWKLVKTIALIQGNIGRQQARICTERDLPNPLLASMWVNIVAPESCAKVSSTLGSGYTSRMTH